MMSRPYSSNGPSQAGFYSSNSGHSFTSRNRRNSRDAPPPRISTTDDYSDSRHIHNRRNSHSSPYDVPNGSRYREDLPRSPVRAEKETDSQAKNDLEILERLKERIKNGQHEVYRPVPQPAVLASLYLGSSSTPAETNEGSKSSTTHLELTQSSVKAEPTSPKFPQGRRVCNAV